MNKASSILFSLDSANKIITKYQLNSVEPRINQISVNTLQNSFKLTEIYFDEQQNNFIAYGEELIKMSVNPDLSKISYRLSYFPSFIPLYTNDIVSVLYVRTRLVIYTGSLDGQIVLWSEILY